MDLIFPPNEVAGVVLDQHISVNAAAEISGYSIQYLRRVLRTDQLEGMKIGQVWLIKLTSSDAYLKRAAHMGDGRCGPRAALRAVTGKTGDPLSTIVNVSRKQT